MLMICATPSCRCKTPLTTSSAPLTRSSYGSPSLANISASRRNVLCMGLVQSKPINLVHGQTLNFRGYLQADRLSPRVWAESVTANIVRIAKDKLQLTVEQSPIVQWIQQQLECNKNIKIVEKKVLNHHGFHL